MAQQNNGSQLRQGASYPSPHSYPSPSMSAYAFPGGPPQQGQIPGPQNVEQYRASPTGSHTSMASLNLPPIRSIDPRQPQGAPQSQQQTMQGSPLPPGLGTMAPIGQYYSHSQTLAPQQHMNITSSPIPMRYPIPANDAQKVISGGRHKKEVKRRTKTGCLTCRKRRIKCDEGHPTCRNCKKSKRECLGYDPIFKPQPAPSAIQPAPNSSSHPSNQAYPPPPQGYVPASQPFPQSLSSGVDSPNSSLGQFDYGAPIDPALEGTSSSQMAAPNAFDGGQAFRSDVKTEANPFPTNSDRPNQKGGASLSHTPAHGPSIPYLDPALSSIQAYGIVSAKKIKIDELFSLHGIAPKPVPPPSSMPTDRLEEVKTMYRGTYAPAIDKFLEVHWFAAKGLPHLLADNALCSRFFTMLDYFSTTDFQNKNSFAEVQSLEASVIWALMEMPSKALSTMNGAVIKDEGNEMADVKDAAEKVRVMEAMITGSHLDINPITSTGGGIANGLQDQMKNRGMQFWRSVGHFLTLHDDEASAAQDIDNTLSTCRVLLDNFENRDVIYSIAVVRHLGQRFHGFPHTIPRSRTNDEKDADAKISVAKKFLEDEGAGRGTTQVIQRVCAMAVRSWYVGR